MHTKGPWYAEQPENANGWWVICNDQGEIGSGDGGYDEEDARLISAASELLEALEGLLRNYEFNECKGLGFGPISKARNAINKTKGK